MFDLFRSRDKAVRWLLTALLVLVALSMVTYLIPGSGMMPGGADEQVVAQVGKEKLTTREVQIGLESMKRNRQIAPEMYTVFAPQYINSMIQDRALALQARQLGFQVSDQELVQAIQATFPMLFPEGKFVGKDIYAQYLGQQNTSIAEFESAMRNQILLSKLQNLVLEGVIVTPNEVEKEFRRTNEKAKVDYIAFNAQKFQSQANPTQQDIQAYFDKNHGGFMIPEKRSFEMVVVDEPRVAATINLTDEDLRRAYQAAGERFRIPERVHVRHILLKTSEKSKDELPKIEAKAKDLLKQVRGGADFADLAKKNSEDPGSAVKGGDLDWVTRGQTVPNFEKTAFSLKPKETSDLIKTEYGFHIIQVLEKETARVRPFEEVKKDLADELKRQMVFDKIQRTADEIRAALVKAPLSADSIAKKYGMSAITVENASSGDPIPELGNSPELSGAVSSLQKGEVTQVIQSGSNRLVVAVLKGITAGRQAELREVEAQVRQAVTSQKVALLVKEKSAEAEQKLKASGDMKTVAKAYGLEVKSTPEFTREGAAEGIGPAAYLLDAFTQPVGTVLKAVEMGGQVFLVKVTGKVEADLGKLAAERSQVVLSLKQRKARERDDLFKDGIMTQMIKEGKIKMHQDVIQRIVASLART
jgi:peptidyl-prolyl cis-trans isomerase D